MAWMAVGDPSDPARCMIPTTRPVHPRSLSDEVCDALPHLGPADAEGGYRHGVDHHKDDAHVDGGVPQPLPRKPLGQPALRPAVEALHHCPQPIVYDPNPLRTLNIVVVLHRQHVGWVVLALHPSPGDDVPDLQGLE